MGLEYLYRIVAHAASYKKTKKPVIKVKYGLRNRAYVLLMTRIGLTASSQFGSLFIQKHFILNIFPHSLSPTIVLKILSIMYLYVYIL